MNAFGILRRGGRCLRPLRGGPGRASCSKLLSLHGKRPRRKKSPWGPSLWLIVGQGRNETEALRDPSAHAEMLALRRAARNVGNHRLGNCVLVVTLEPCLMCAGVIREARVQGVVYGAHDVRAGAVESRLEGLSYADGPSPWHMGGVESRACAELLRDFFRVRRS